MAPEAWQTASDGACVTRAIGISAGLLSLPHHCSPVSSPILPRHKPLWSLSEPSPSRSSWSSPVPQRRQGKECWEPHRGNARRERVLETAQGRGGRRTSGGVSCPRPSPVPVPMTGSGRLPPSGLGMCAVTPHDALPLRPEWTLHDKVTHDTR